MSPVSRLLAAAVIVSSSALQTAAPGDWQTLAREPRDAAAMDAFLRKALEQPGVSALSVAVIDGGRTVYSRTLGALDPSGRARADERTVFRAASLTKPVFSYLVMKLADERVIDLDRPIHRYLPQPLYNYPAYASFRNDPRHLQLTARMLLSHQGGLPNWRRDRPDGPIGFHSSPGDRFAYSGEGYALLQFAVETVTRRDLATLAREKVFEPLGMNDSSLLWEDRFTGRFAVDLGGGLGGLIRQTQQEGNAAASLITNAADYAKFLEAVVNGSGLNASTRAIWLQPQMAITSRSLFSEPGTDGGANRQHGLAWTPGWGTFEDRNGRALFHVGMEEGCENFAEIFLDRKLALVYFSLTDNRSSFSASLVEYALGRAFSPLEWLEYGDARPLDRMRPLLVPALIGLAAAIVAAAAWLIIRRTRRSKETDR